MPRKLETSSFIIDHNVENFGLTNTTIKGALEYVYSILDEIDESLVSKEEGRLSELIELANLSAVIGNLLRGGISKCSNGRFIANSPHKYPDLISNEQDFEDIEIKIALENNNPKGHLVKPGPHITARYVLGSINGTYIGGKENRGNVAWFWELRVGYLEEEHFNVSNTEGDSGKTAVINSDGMSALHVAFCDLEKCPYSRSGKIYKSLENLFTPRLSI